MYENILTSINIAMVRGKVDQELIAKTLTAFFLEVGGKMQNSLPVSSMSAKSVDHHNHPEFPDC